MRFKHIITIFVLLSVLGCNTKILFLSKDDCDKPNTRVPEGRQVEPEEVALDAFCAEVITNRSAPQGFLTIFGSARAKEGMRSYDDTRTFAKLWTRKYGAKHPILTGGGPGIMEAGNYGAKEAGGPSLGFSTYFLGGHEPLNTYITDGYVFASFAQREAEMVDRAAAILVAPGGVGTEWEIFETISKIQTGKKTQVPLVLLGERSVWASLFDRLEHMVKIKTISSEDPEILQVAPTPQKAVEIIAKQLKL